MNPKNNKKFKNQNYGNGNANNLHTLWRNIRFK